MKYKTPLFIVLLVVLGKIISIYLVAQSRPYLLEYISGIEDKGDRTFILSRLEGEANPLLYGLGYHLDSVYYVNIAGRGYYDDADYAFPPLYPMIIRLVSFGFDRIFVAVVVANLFYIASILLFYKTALLYMDETLSSAATLCYAFFPPNFAYGTVAYSEPVFLAFTIGSWYLFKKKQYLGSGLFITLASLTRLAGVLLFPITSFAYLWGWLRDKGWGCKKVFSDLMKLNIISVITVYWLFFGASSGVGNNVSDLGYWGSISHSLSSHLNNWGTYIGFPFSSVMWLWNMGSPSAVHITLFLVVFLILGVSLRRISPELLFYSVFLIVFYTSITYTTDKWSTSMPIVRYLGTVWPVYLAMGVKLKDRLSLYPVLAGFYVFGVIIIILYAHWIFFA